ncbi:hypothetical protein ACFE04_007558 [Oxalis oulophora]
MEDAMAARYWCHMCSQMVNPIMEAEIKCPFCQSGFIEEISSDDHTTTTTTMTQGAMISSGGEEDNNNNNNNNNNDSDFGSDRALSLWAPILLGMMGNPRRRRRFRRLEFDEDDDDNNDAGDAARFGAGGETELDRELESIIRRRRRSSATILQLLQGIRAGMASESENSENRERERERDRVILINPFNQTVILQNSGDSQNLDRTPNIGSLGDYFVGPGLDMLLQHLAENDPNRYGTPPAQKEVVEAMPTVSVKENIQCSVCLDDFEIGAEAKEMPCKHKFHNECILPWLELHSSCPVCRYQLPADESKLNSERSMDNNHLDSNNVRSEEGDGDQRNGSERRFSIPWPFNGLFSSSSPRAGGGGGGNSSSSAGSRFGNASREDEN